MRTPSLFVAVSLAALVASCSKAESRADANLDRDLDLALGKSSNGVASQLEVNGVQKPKPQAPAAPHVSSTAMAMAHMKQESAPEKVAIPEPAAVAAGTGEATVNAKTTPAPEAASTTTTPSTTQAPQPSSEPVRTGRGGGWYPIPTDIGVENPGRGPVIIIRGGGTGDDACDETGEHGRGGTGTIGIGGIGGNGGTHGGAGGGILPPRGPSRPGPIGRRF